MYTTIHNPFTTGKRLELCVLPGYTSCYSWSLSMLIASALFQKSCDCFLLQGYGMVCLRYSWYSIAIIAIIAQQRDSLAASAVVFFPAESWARSGVGWLDDFDLGWSHIPKRGNVSKNVIQKNKVNKVYKVVPPQWCERWFIIPIAIDITP